MWENCDLNSQGKKILMHIWTRIMQPWWLQVTFITFHEYFSPGDLPCCLVYLHSKQINDSHLKSLYVTRFIISKNLSTEDWKCASFCLSLFVSVHISVCFYYFGIYVLTVTDGASLFGCWEDVLFHQTICFLISSQAEEACLLLQMRK